MDTQERETSMKKVIALLLTAAAIITAPVFAPPDGESERLLPAPRRAVAIDMSEYSHTPPSFEFGVRNSGFGIYEHEPVFASAPLSVPSSAPLGEPREFRALTGDWTKVTADLLAAGEHVNIWVSRCSPPLAQSGMDWIAEQFDVIYTAMTDSFGAHAGVQIHTEYSNMPLVGDLGNDGKVNFLMYDIADGISGFFSNGDFFTDPGFNNLDMMHVSAKLAAAAVAPNADEAAQFALLNTLAHEFQHMLFYIHFGIYTETNEYLWFNEVLSELAGTYHVREGVEVSDYNRLNAAVQNSYSGGGYGDFLNFNNSLKSYGMSKLFGMLMYTHYGDDFTRRIYAAMAELYPPHTYDANRRRIAADGHDLTVGRLLRAAAGCTDSEDAEFFELLYHRFMEHFAADGGLIGGVAAAKLYSGSNPVDNLWSIRSVAGSRNPDGRVFFVAGGTGLAYNQSTATAFPVLNSGGNIALRGYGGSTARGASHEMLYRLSCSGLPVLNITAPDASARYYVAVPNDPLVEIPAFGTTPGRVYSDGAGGADVFRLENGVVSEIDTGGRGAFLLVVTLYRNVSSTIAYSWTDSLVTHSAVPPPPTPVETTAAAPVETTAAPVETTAAPVETTAATVGHTPEDTPTLLIIVGDNWIDVHNPGDKAISTKGMLIDGLDVYAVIVRAGETVRIAGEDYDGVVLKRMRADFALLAL
jgi:hypothetical protein